MNKSILTVDQLEAPLCSARPCTNRLGEGEMVEVAWGDGSPQGRRALALCGPCWNSLQLAVTRYAVDGVRPA